MSASQRRTGRAARWGMLVAALGAAGCAPSHADVTGSVSYRGRPVVWGTVSVVGADGMTYYGPVRPDGTFAVPGVPVGPARFGVYSPDPYFEPPLPPDVKRRVEEARRAAAPRDPPKPPKGQWVRLPPKYTDPLTSGLTAEVAGPETVFDLRLE